MLKKLLFYSIVLTKIIIFFPFVIIFIFLNKFFNFHIVEFPTKKIGECINAILLERENDNKFIFFYSEKIKSNNFLLQKLKKKYFFIPRTIGTLLSLIQNDKNYNWKNFFDLKKKALVNLKSFNNNFLKLNNNELDIVESYLKQTNYDKEKKLVILAIRSKHYYNEKFNSVRNSDLKNYHKIIEFFNNKKINLVILCDPEMKYNNFPSDKNCSVRILDSKYFKNKNEYELVQQYFFSSCSYILGTNVGLQNMGFLYKKRYAYLNWSIPNYFTGFYNGEENLIKIILIKKYKRKDSNEKITYEKIIASSIKYINTEEDLLNKGIYLEKNTDDEILNCVVEMENLNFDNYEINYKEQENFWKIFSKNYKANSDRIIISKNFFKKYRDLF